MLLRDWCGHKGREGGRIERVEYPDSINYLESGC